MHLADGFLSVPVTVGATAAALAGIGVAARGAARPWKERAALTLAGATAVFAAQAANFPAASGVSVHVIGAGLLGAAIGYAGALALVVPVVVAQAALGDGGLLSLGANLLNLAVVPAAVAASIARGGGSARRGVAAFLGVAAAVGACTLELILSGRGPASALLADMARFHVPVATLEALGAAAWVAVAARADVAPRTALRGACAAVAVLALGAACASSAPDGLETVAERHGFADAAR
ncbi:MAG TPA: energy-coupling factor ABC transporter permease [Planctomycetota bacterium]|nr:energy-coupling factor ABC transporter permease [Planctomycetota bacterium]